MNWIDEVNKRMEESRLQKKEAGITEKSIKKKQASYEGGISNKDRKHSDETKKIWSQVKVGKKRTKDSVSKSIEGIKKTKWEQTLNRLSKEDILSAQRKYGNHQSNTMKELNISFHPYKKLCEHYGIELKKSNYEKTEWARKNQSQEVNVYKYNKTKVNGCDEFIGTFYSIAEACRHLGIEKNRGHAISVANGKRPHTNGYVFVKIK